MYIKPKTEKRYRLDSKEMAHLCEIQNEIVLKHLASTKETQPEDQILSQLTPLLVSYLFKKKIGVMPYDFEEVNNE